MKSLSARSKSGRAWTQSWSHARRSASASSGAGSFASDPVGTGRSATRIASRQASLTRPSTRPLALTGVTPYHATSTVRFNYIADIATCAEEPDRTGQIKAASCKPDLGPAVIEPKVQCPLNGRTRGVENLGTRVAQSDCSGSCATANWSAVSNCHHWPDDKSESGTSVEFGNRSLSIGTQPGRLLNQRTMRLKISD